MCSTRVASARVFGRWVSAVPRSGPSYLVLSVSRARSAILSDKTDLFPKMCCCTHHRSPGTWTRPTMLTHRRAGRAREHVRTEGGQPAGQGRGVPGD